MSRCIFDDGQKLHFHNCDQLKLLFWPERIQTDVLQRAGTVPAGFKIGKSEARPGFATTMECGYTAAEKARGGGARGVEMKSG